MLKPNSKFKIQIHKFRHNLTVFAIIISFKFKGQKWKNLQKNKGKN